MMHARLVLFTLFLFSQSHAMKCGDIFDSPSKALRLSAKKNLKTNNEIFIADEILKMSMKVNSLGGYSQVAKFLIDVRNPESPRTIFFNTADYKLHHSFVTAQLGYRDSIEKFQEKNYDGNFRQREYILASLLIKLTPGDRPEGIIELFSGDTLDAESIQMMTDQVIRHTTGFAGIRFHPMSDRQDEFASKALPASLVIRTRDLAAGLNYLPLNSGVAKAYVKIVSKADYEAGKVLLGPSQLAVFDQVPNDIGLVRGVVTAELQTALSHINVKSINRGTANVYLKNALEQFRHLDGQPVLFEANNDSIQIKRITAEEVDRDLVEFWNSKRKVLAEKPKFILSQALDGRLLDLRSHYTKLPTVLQHRRLIQIVGAKAANLALLNYIIKSRNLDVVAPESAAQPFNAHHAFLQLRQIGLDPHKPDRVMTLADRITEILRQGDLLNREKIHSIEVVAKTLNEVRATIVRATVPDSTMDALKEMIMKDATSPIHISKYPRLRFRSSTNSEDMEGFTGAGLYDSGGVNLYKKNPDGSFDRTSRRKWKKIAEDIKQLIPRLYSSIFNERAFMEREWFGINGDLHLMIKAGLAIHGAFPLKGFDGEPGEIANGVAITTDLYREKSDYPKIFINAQHYDLSVTNPPNREDLAKFGEKDGATYSTEESMVSAYLADYAKDAQPDAWKQWPVDQIRRSSVRAGANVLGFAKSGGELRRLAHALRVINQDMAKVFGIEDADTFPIDFEFKIYGPDRKIYIKQARPFVR